VEAKNFAEIALPIPGKNTYTYSIPDALREKIDLGSSVLVPVHGRTLPGFVVDFKAETELEEVKEIVEVSVDTTFPKNLIPLSKWMSDYYLCPLGKVMKMMLPKGIYKKEEKILKLVSIPRAENSLTSKIIDMLSKKGEIKLSTVLKSLGKSSHTGRMTYSRIKALERKGYVEIVTQMKKPPLKIKTSRYIKSKKTIEDLLDEYKKTRSKKVACALKWLIENPEEIPVLELYKKSGTDSKSIKRLENAGIIESIYKEEFRDPLSEFFCKESAPPYLTDDQSHALNHIIEVLQKLDFEVMLLHGVTGSGKTEVYMRAIDECLKLRRQTIFLVPEIFLVSQILTQFLLRFGKKVAVLHSSLSSGEHYDVWRKIQEGYYDIIVGARSAVFAPLKDVGLIIVDEEFETSYKQDEVDPKYHAREVAIMRAKFEHALCILGSATPSLETYNNVKKKKFRLFTLPQRIESRPLPPVTIVDMKKEKDFIFSELLKEKLEDRLEKKEQTVLFINRRGHSNFIQCMDCGFVMRCPRCSVTLTYHIRPPKLKCHYCGYEKRAPNVCPVCKGRYISLTGLGTQKVEKELQKFLQARILRVDLDTTTVKGSHLSLFRKFKNKEADILLGTQMVAKGFDFPDVTLVGVISADTALNLPDFRASERTFQLLTQVAGRAGRSSLGGEVVIQTCSPSNYAIKYAATHSYNEFFSEEILYRKELFYPPFSRLGKIVVRSKLQGEARSVAFGIEKRLKAKVGKGIEILGPAPDPVFQVRGYYRWMILLKADRFFAIQKLIKNILHQKIDYGTAKISVDIDPM